MAIAHIRNNESKWLFSEINCLDVKFMNVYNGLRAGCRREQSSRSKESKEKKPVVSFSSVMWLLGSDFNMIAKNVRNNTVVFRKSFLLTKNTLHL